MSQQIMHDIGMALLNGASWAAVLSDPRWSDQPVYLHWEKDRLDGQMDLEGVYFSEEGADRAASNSPQWRSPYTWKIFTAATTLGKLADNSRAHYLLARQIRMALADNPAARPVDLWLRDSSAYLSTDGTRIVLFEDGAHFTTSDTERFITRTDPPLAGLFNQQGQIVIPAQYENIDGFHEDLAAAQLNGFYGVIDRSGQWVLEPSFLYLSFFHNGVSTAQVKTGWGQVSRNGEWVIPPLYAEYFFFHDGLAKVARKSGDFTLYGLINTANQEVLPTRYKRLESSGSEWNPWDYVLACDDAGLWGAFTMRGELAVALEHDSEAAVRELLHELE